MRVIGQRLDTGTARKSRQFGGDGVANLNLRVSRQLPQLFGGPGRPLD